MVIQQGRRGEKPGGVPSGVRRGFFRAENAVGGHFQRPSDVKVLFDADIPLSRIAQHRHDIFAWS
jgi:hypothetical protein